MKKQSVFISDKPLGLGPDPNFNPDVDISKNGFWDKANKAIETINRAVDTVENVFNPGDGQNGSGSNAGLPTAYSGSQSNQVMPWRTLAWAGAGTLVLFGTIKMVGRNKDED